MRIVLVNTSLETSRFPKIGFFLPPYWAAILARKIRDHGDDVKLLDLQFQEPRSFEIPKEYYENVDAVLVSGMTPCYPQMMDVSKFYRSKGIKVIFGGWAATALYHSRNVIKLKEHLFPFCDAAMIGEAEAAIDDLLEDLKRKNSEGTDFIPATQTSGIGSCPILRYGTKNTNTSLAPYRPSADAR